MRCVRTCGGGPTKLVLIFEPRIRSSGATLKGRHMSRAALVCGAGGFIGGHLVKRLKKEGILGPWNGY